MDDHENKNKKPDSSSKNSYVGYGVSFGLLGGAAFSTIFGMLYDFPLIWAFGPGFGLLIGIIIGAVMDSNRNQK